MIVELETQISESLSRTEILENQRNQILGQLEKFQSRRDFLADIIESYEGFSESVRYVMSFKNNFNGLIDTLANLVDVDDQYKDALTSYLEVIANYVVVDRVDTAREIINDINEKKKGRLTLLPLTQKTLQKIPSNKLLETNGGVQYLKDVIRCDPKYHDLFQRLFDRVILVKDMEKALHYHSKHPEFEFLTFNGEIVGEWGDITGGNTYHSVNLVGRRRQFQDILQKMQHSEKELKGLNSEIDKLQNKIVDLKEVRDNSKSRFEEIQKSVLSVEKKIDQIIYEKQHLQARISEIEDEKKKFENFINDSNKKEEELSPVVKNANLEQEKILEVEQQMLSELDEADQHFRDMSQERQDRQISVITHKNKLNELHQKIEFIDRSKTETQERIAEARQEVQNATRTILTLKKEIKAAQDQLKTYYQDRDKIETEKLTVENNYQSLKSLLLSREEEIKKLHRRWNQALERLKELELKIQEIEIKQKTQKEQLQDQFGEELRALLETHVIPENINVAQIQENISDLRQRLEGLGEVNPLAVKEYDKEKERLVFLKSQQADLDKAKKELLETINKLNKTARSLFMDTFTKINENFMNVFGKFFEGGQAELQLTDNEDPLESNIDFSVKIKGRKLMSLNLMSAGEKTLTAISLLFAIYLYKPSPFCILDEVDAPLDDVNISRYTHALKEFSDNTQFILVTHNKMTMQAAQAMYGITMEEPGVSKVVSVRFD
jgi:chromosome segregation protein